VLIGAIQAGVALLTWTIDSFGFADSFDETANRYRGLRGGQLLTLSDTDMPGMLVKPEVARKQMDAESVKPPAGGSFEEMLVGGGGGGIRTPGPRSTPETPTPVQPQPRRFHGTVLLDPARVGRDASRIADEVIAHLSGMVGATVTVTLEVEAEIPSGAPDHVVRTVTENSRTLKFTSHGFEKE
jgi:hypothetical protein